MFFNTLTRLRPVTSFLRQTRFVRPTVKISKEKFQLSIDVRNYNRDEIRVKALPEYVMIEGKQEKKTKNGFIMRQFVRKFRLPDGCSPETMRSTLSKDGILTITAPRRVWEPNLPCETLIPLHFTDKKSDPTDPLIPPDEPKSKEELCSKFEERAPDKKTK